MDTEPLPPPPTPVPGLRARLRDALRIAALQRVRHALAPSWLEIIAAGFLTVCVPTLAAAIGLGSAGRWSLWDLPQVLFHIPLALAAAAAAAAVLRRGEDVPELLFATLIAWFAIDAVTLALWNLAPLVLGERAISRLEPLFFYGRLGWLALALARFAATRAAPRALGHAAILAAYVLLLAAPLAYLHPERSLWVKDWSLQGDENAEREARSGVATEAAFYRQPALLADALAALRPGRKGVADVYFVGVAGFGRQDVFRREVDAVAQLMVERFDAAGHVVKLVNNARSGRSSPIASATSLAAALRRVASVMDVEEDVLVLYLTSHGSADHRFALQEWPLRLDDLDAPRLRSMLDASGIRNRVVVISACYAGGFIDALEDAHTLVVTAAAADRTSFGCSNESAWTYFGQAYFNQALRETHSFTRAFEIARPLVARREKAEGYEPSDPQVSVGADIDGTLARLAARLDAQSPAQDLQGPAATR